MVKIKYSKSLQEYYDYRGILKLPDEMLIDIFKCCGVLVCHTLKQVNKRFHRIIKGEKINLPKWINRFIQPILYPFNFQFDVVKWMTLQKHGAILNIEMGLGKTSTSLLYINVTYSLRNLVICNKAQMSVWKHEVKKFYGKQLKILLAHTEYDGHVKDFKKEILETYDIVVVTYQLVKHIVDRANEISQIFWNNIFCDEVHTLRNCPVSMYPYIEKIQRDKFWGLTGSLIFNSINDARNIQTLIDPSSIYSTNNIKKLRFSDVDITLPPLTVQTISTVRTKRQEEVYKRYENRAVELIEELGSISKNIAAIFTIIHRLRQISISLALLKKSHSKLGELNDYNTWKSPRIEDICSKIESDPEQAVVFSSYVGSLELIQINLTKRGIKSVIIKSEQSLAMREYYMDRFYRKKYLVLLITYQIGALGYTFTNASKVYLGNAWWNLQIMQQAFKRVYRLGQTKPVTVFIYITKDSIESRMMEICLQKQSIEEALFAEHKNKTKLTIDEIKQLF